MKSNAALLFVFLCLGVFVAGCGSKTPLTFRVDTPLNCCVAPYPDDGAGRGTAIELIATSSDGSRQAFSGDVNASLAYSCYGAQAYKEIFSWQGPVTPSDFSKARQGPVLRIPLGQDLDGYTGMFLTRASVRLAGTSDWKSATGVNQGFFQNQRPLPSFACIPFEAAVEAFPCWHGQFETEVDKEEVRRYLPSGFNAVGESAATATLGIALATCEKATFRFSAQEAQDTLRFALVSVRVQTFANWARAQAENAFLLETLVGYDLERHLGPDLDTLGLVRSESTISHAEAVLRASWKAGGYDAVSEGLSMLRAWNASRFFFTNNEGSVRWMDVDTSLRGSDWLTRVEALYGVLADVFSASAGHAEGRTVEGDDVEVSFRFGEPNRVLPERPAGLLSMRG